MRNSSLVHIVDPCLVQVGRFIYEQKKIVRIRIQFKPIKVIYEMIPER